ncbi:TPA: hypothetical protein JD264_22285 [Serratia fonticola]|nr:hypothetical protein [Serratia fonticola]
MRYPLLACLLILAGLVGYMLFGFSPLVQTVVHKERVNNLANLYVTQGDAGATTAYSYRYYIYDASKSDDDFKAELGDITPFFVTADSHALLRVSGGVVLLTTKEKIYQFTNRAAYRYNGSVYEVVISLSAPAYEKRP